MNKRIISLILAFLLMAGVMLTGCGGEEDDQSTIENVNTTASTSTITLTMYVVTGEETTEEAEKKVEEAFNQITKSKFKTQVKLYFCTYDEYYTTIEGVINANMDEEVQKENHDKALKDAKKLAKAEAVSTDDAWFDAFYGEHPEWDKFRETEAEESTEETEPETVLNEYNFAEYKYPELVDNQIDIIYIDSYDRYMSYIQKEWLARIDEELTSSSKILSNYICPSLMAWAKWAGEGTYAVPNNVVVGEYTYLLLNKDLVDKYNYNYETLTNLSRCSDYLKDIAKYEKDVLPIVGELPITLTHYWSVNPDTYRIEPDTFSILGNTFNSMRSVNPAVTSNAPVGSKNIFKSSDYVAQLLAIQSYKDNGYITVDTNTDKTYALRVVKGGAELAKVYGDDYYMNVLDYPRIDEEAAFGNMFGVTEFTRSLSRSMEIITYLNTNSQLRNVLQYGVQGVHYKLNDDGTITRLNHDYMMDINRTGNVFIAYPEEGFDADIWTYGKLQNLDVKTTMTLGFVPGEEVIAGLNKAELAEVRRVSEDVWARLQAVKNVDELQTLIDECSTLNDTNRSLKNQTSAVAVTGLDADGKEVEINESIYAAYYTWMKDTSLYVPEE